MKRQREGGQGRIGMKRWGAPGAPGEQRDTTWGMLLPVGSEQDRTWLLEKTTGEKDEHREEKKK